MSTNYLLKISIKFVKTFRKICLTNPTKFVIVSHHLLKIFTKFIKNFRKIICSIFPKNLFKYSAKFLQKLFQKIHKICLKFPHFHEI